MLARPPGYPRPVRTPRAEFCYLCGRERAPGDYGCPCGGSTYGPEAPGGRVVAAPRARLTLGGPLGRVVQPGPGVVLVAGRRGAGKTTIAIQAVGARLDAVAVSAEMDVPELSAYGERLGVRFERYTRDLDVEAVDLGFAPPVPRILVVDSLQAVPGAPLDTARALVAWAKRRGAVVIATSRVTKAGQIEGFEQIPHLVDVVAVVAREAGRATLTIEKNRFGREGSTVFDVGNADAPRWGRRYYSIEGVAPDFRAVPYPTPGARYAACLAAAASSPEVRERLPDPPAAVAALDGGALYPGRWIDPPDVAERRAWAELHGLPFFAFSPEGAA